MKKFLNIHEQLTDNTGGMIQDDNGNIVYAECSMDKKYRPKDIESPKGISENYYLVRRTMKDTGWNFYIYRPKAVSENAIHKLLLKIFRLFDQCSSSEFSGICFFPPYGIAVGVID